MSASRLFLSILLVGGVAATPALAQRLGKPTYSQEDPDQQQRIERDRAATQPTKLGAAVTELVVKPGEKTPVVLSAGADGATVVNLVEGTPPRNAVTVSLTVKAGVSTLRVDNRSGAVIGFKIDADPTGAGGWAAAGTVSGVKNQQVSSTDYQLALHAVRITGLTLATKN